EWWRALTALTLHADGVHVLGNAVGLALLLTAACLDLGSGVALCLVLLAGVAGNALTALVHRAGHVSVGASTALFGAIGLLAAVRVLAPRRVGLRATRPWVVAGAVLVLLALLGTAPNADLLAHLFGLLAGAALGAVGALTLRWRVPAAVQWLLVAAAGAAVAGAWRLAL
ncbi:MAG TPA: rhomboid family intramembrane serine protease, partial [Methylomirabilota bacterium]|nr:rhomboid family intramembrane serine protease [Methylomirabilota bacterium]